MKGTLVVLVISLSATPSWSLSTVMRRNDVRSDAGALTLDETSIRIEKFSAPDDLEDGADFGQTMTTTPLLEDITNIGSKFWTIIEANHPVADVRTQYATALPKGAIRWTDMTDWQPPRATTYELSARNIYGIQVLKIRYKVLRTFGGHYHGKGQYLTAVAVDPTFIDVAWGYSCTLEASVPESSVVNVGTSENPIAGMTATLTWRVKTVVRASQGKGMYFLDGSGALSEVGGLFSADAVDTPSWKR